MSFESKHVVRSPHKQWCTPGLGRAPSAARDNVEFVVGSLNLAGDDRI